MKNEKKKQPALQNTHLDFDAQLLKKEEWLTTEEVMKHLNVSRSTLYRLRKKHNIPNFKLGRIPIYPRHLLNKVFMHKALSNISKSESNNLPFTVIFNKHRDK